MLEFKAKFDFAAMSDAEGEVDARGAAQAQLTAENTSLRNVNETFKSEVRKLEEERNSLLLALRLMSTSESKEIPLSVDKNHSRQTRQLQQRLSETAKRKKFWA
jgi:ABC-type phosphate transport system auxiliary subunit